MYIYLALPVTKENDVEKFIEEGESKKLHARKFENRVYHESSRRRSKSDRSSSTREFNDVKL